MELRFMSPPIEKAQTNGGKRQRREDDPAGEAQPLLKLEEFIPYRLNTLAASVSQLLTPIYRDRFGLNQAEWRAIMALGQHGVLTPTVVGQVSGMQKAKVSRAVAQLEGKKLVVRRSNRDDLREAFLTLTPAGMSIYEKLARQSLAFDERITKVINPADRPAFERVYASLAEFARVVAAEIAEKKGR
jgi:DNA-binding MarR family transcriptional regulator